MAATDYDVVTLAQLKMLMNGGSSYLDTFWQGSASLSRSETSSGGGRFYSNVVQISANKITDARTNDRRITWTFEDAGIYVAHIDCEYNGDYTAHIQSSAYVRLPGKTTNTYLFVGGQNFTFRFVVEAGQTFYIELPSDFEYEEGLSANVLFERIG